MPPARRRRRPRRCAGRRCGCHACRRSRARRGAGRGARRRRRRAAMAAAGRGGGRACCRRARRPRRKRRSPEAPPAERAGEDEAPRCRCAGGRRAIRARATLRVAGGKAGADGVAARVGGGRRPLPAAGLEAGAGGCGEALPGARGCAGRARRRSRRRRRRRRWKPPRRVGAEPRCRGRRPGIWRPSRGRGRRVRGGGGAVAQAPAPPPAAQPQAVVGQLAVAIGRARTTGGDPARSAGARAGADPPHPDRRRGAGGGAGRPAGDAGPAAPPRRALARELDAAGYDTVSLDFAAAARPTPGARRRGMDWVAGGAGGAGDRCRRPRRRPRRAGASPAGSTSASDQRKDAPMEITPTDRRDRRHREVRRPRGGRDRGRGRRRLPDLPDAAHHADAQPGPAEADGIRPSSWRSSPASRRSSSRSAATTGCRASSTCSRAAAPPAWREWIGREVRVAAKADFAGAPVEVGVTPVEGADKAVLVVRNDFDSVVARLPVAADATEVTWDGKDDMGDSARARPLRLHAGELCRRHAAGDRSRARSSATVQEVRHRRRRAGAGGRRAARRCRSTRSAAVR